jgi:ribonuclease PH
LRPDNRKSEQLREIAIEFPFISSNKASLLMRFGKTRVICSAIVDERVPPFLKNSGRGWISCEYAMLPSSGGRERIQRERQKVNGRVQEIERFISRALRLSVDLRAIGERTVIIDCDVIEADGSTRCVAFNGGMFALLLALKELVYEHKIADMPRSDLFAAVSVGIVNRELLVDLDYQEDSSCQMDLNLISGQEGQISQVLALGEECAVGRDLFQQALSAGIEANRRIIEIMKKSLKEEGFEI